MNKNKVLFYAKEFELVRNFLAKLSVKLGITTCKNSIYKLRNLHYKKMKRRFFHLIPDDKIEYINTGDINKQIFVYWNSGFENAPDIVKKCVASLKQQKDYEIVLLSNNNLKDYIEFPNFIIEKYKKGFISNTHLSDLIRTNLMVKYGGVWVDATVFLSNSIPNDFLKQPLFLLKHETFIDDMSYGYNNRFIISQKNNPILKIMLNLLYTYREKENYVLDYFLWHLFMLLIAEKQQEYLDKIITYIDYDAHIYQNYMFKKFDDDQRNNILQRSFVHKLTYKYNKKELSEDCFIEKTLLKDF